MFVTSHEAHFHGRQTRSGRVRTHRGEQANGEDALRKMNPDAPEKRGIELIVVLGDMIDGTIIVRLLERREPAMPWRHVEGSRAVANGCGVRSGESPTPAWS